MTSTGGLTLERTLLPAGGGWGGARAQPRVCVDGGATLSSRRLWGAAVQLQRRRPACVSVGGRSALVPMLCLSDRRGQ